VTSQISLLPEEKRTPRVLYFDLETLRDAGEVGGWDNIRKMGMAIGVCFDSLDQRFFTYEEKDVASLVSHLRRADLVIGFNQIRFDYTVLAGYSTFDFKLLPSFDILDDITRILGHRLKLESLVRSTLGIGKSADGLQSLRWVKEGRMDLVAQYCRKDVEVTRDLFLFGQREGFVTFEKSERIVKVPVEWQFEGLFRKVKGPAKG
jgi:DEAD/DEAH box helicase domain-containing protein